MRGLAVQLLRAVARELQKTAEEAHKDVQYAYIFAYSVNQLLDRADERGRSIQVQPHESSCSLAV